MSLIKDICIGTAAFVIACVLTLSSSIDGYQIIDKALSIRPNYATALDNKNKILDLLGKQ